MTSARVILCQLGGSYEPIFKKKQFYACFLVRKGSDSEQILVFGVGADTVLLQESVMEGATHPDVCWFIYKIFIFL